MIGQPLGRVKLGARTGTAYYDAAHKNHLTVLIGDTEYFARRDRVVFLKKKED